MPCPGGQPSAVGLAGVDHDVGVQQHDSLPPGLDDIFTDGALPCHRISDVAVGVQLSYFFQGGHASGNHFGGGPWDLALGFAFADIGHCQQHMGTSGFEPVGQRREQLQAAVGRDLDVGFQRVHGGGRIRASVGP